MSKKSDEKKLEEKFEPKEFEDYDEISDEEKKEIDYSESQKVLEAITLVDAIIAGDQDAAVGIIQVLITAYEIEKKSKITKGLAREATQAIDKVIWVDFKDDEVDSKRRQEFTTPFALAISRRQAKVVWELGKLLDYFLNEEERPFGLNSLLNVAVIENISQEGIEYLITEFQPRLELSGRNPLFSATSLRHLNIVKILTEIGCDVNSVDQYGKSVLMFAAFNNCREIVSYLIDNANVKNWDLVASFDHEMSEISGRICPNRNPVQKSILSLLIENGDWQNARKLMAKGANINKMVGGCQVMFWAIGVDPAHDEKDPTSFDRHKSLFIKSAIEEYGFDLTKMDYKDNSLFIAATLRSDRLITMTIESCIENMHDKKSAEENSVEKNQHQPESSPSSRPSTPSSQGTLKIIKSADLSATK